MWGTATTWAWIPIAPQTSGSSWRCGCCCNSSTAWSPWPHYPATYPSQLFFLKENTGYEIVVYEGEQHLAKLLHPQEDLKYIFVVPNLQMAGQLTLPLVPCLFSTVEFQGEEEPQVHFFAEEDALGNGTA